MSAFSKKVSLKNFRIKGKQESFRVKDGIKNFVVLPFPECISTPIIDNIKGVIENRMIFKAKAKIVNKIILLSTFNSLMKIAAGKASVSIKLFNPLVSSIAAIFFFKRISIIIIRINERDFLWASFRN